jgi:hypothetical protein
MRVPSFVGIDKHKVQLAAASDHKQICENYATGLHPNPYLYKYYWWVFWSQSPVDGLAFLDKAYRLNTAEASRLNPLIMMGLVLLPTSLLLIFRKLRIPFLWRLTRHNFPKRLIHLRAKLIRLPCRTTRQLTHAHLFTNL